MATTTTTTTNPSSLARSPTYQSLLTSLLPTTLRHRIASSPYEKIPISDFEKAHPFPTALDLLRIDEEDTHTGFAPYTEFEIHLLGLLCKIKERERWWEKMENAEIWGRWMREMKEGTEEEWKRMRVKAWGGRVERYLKDFLTWEKGQRGTRGPFEEMAECVYKSDDIIPSTLRARLLAAVQPFEQVPENLKDWHPHSNNTVLDLVHPSLFPLVYNESKVVDEPLTLDTCLRAMGSGHTIPPPPGSDFGIREDITSERFQWLPTEFAIDADTGALKAKSYINNLHPERHQELYAVVEEVFSKAVPVLDAVLTAVVNEAREYIKAEYCQWKHVSRKEYNAEDEDYRNEEDEDGEEEDEDEEKDEEDEEEEKPPKGKKPKIYDDSSEEEDLSDDGYDMRPRIFVGPRIKPFAPPEYKTKISLKKFGTLQAIIKLANIELTPSNPTYDGGVWHVEGATNESIIASALYYYDSENIEGGTLHFRMSVGLPPYDQNDEKGVRLAYGLDEGTGRVQRLGSVDTLPGRLICFPNLYQHRLTGPLKLIDPTRPGSRKLLAIFLVDPFHPIPSTSDVPPQQREWWSEEIWREESRVSGVPREVFENIVEGVEGLKGMKWAKEVREELMKERSAKMEEAEEKVFNREFSLCEH